MGVFICFLYIFMLMYLNKVGNLDYKLWDVQTVTAADFTVEQVITKHLWRKYKEQVTANESEYGTSMDFETYLREEYEKLVSA